MKTIDLDLAQELQSVCKEKGITMPESYKKEMIGLQGEPVYSLSVQPIYVNLYTLDELLEWIKTANRWVSVEWNVSDKDWVAWCENKAREDIYKYDINPANAACKLLIYLIKEGLI